MAAASSQRGKAYVFYSWQSDLPNRTNRSLIETALHQASDALHADDSIEIDVVLDRDTAGVPGSPEIGATIFGKIERSGVFVADVSVVGAYAPSRPTVNPNVLLELGYAAKHLTRDRIVMVFNTDMDE